MTQFLNDPEDCTWLQETALRGYDVPAFRSFILDGNEDMPQRVRLFADVDPRYDADPIATYTLTVDAHSNLSVYVRS
jgi:hypothetical protein